MIQSIYTMSFQTVFLVFLGFSVIGWCSEVIYVGVFIEHKFVNRGFLHGPLCPVYGFGGLAILCLPESILNSWVPLFFCSMAFATIVEYFASWILEKMFNTLWWDYSDQKFNINGRVCLLNALLFGAMGIGVVHFLEPVILWLIAQLSGIYLTVTFNGLLAILLFDLIATIRRLVDFHTTMERLKNFGDTLKAHYENENWFNKSSVGEMLSSVKEHLLSLPGSEKLHQLHLSYVEKFQNRNKNVEAFIKKFPTLKSKQYKELVSYFKEKTSSNKK